MSKSDPRTSGARMPTDAKVLRVQLRHAREDAVKAGTLADAALAQNERLRWVIDQVRSRLRLHLDDFPGSVLLEGTWELACDALEGKGLERHGASFGPDVEPMTYQQALAERDEMR